MIISFYRNRFVDVRMIYFCYSYVVSSDHNYRNFLHAVSHANPLPCFPSSRVGFETCYYSLQISQTNSGFFVFVNVFLSVSFRSKELVNAVGTCTAVCYADAGATVILLFCVSTIVRIVRYNNIILSQR